MCGAAAAWILGACSSNRSLLQCTTLLCLPLAGHGRLSLAGTRSLSRVSCPQYGRRTLYHLFPCLSALSLC